MAGTVIAVASGKGGVGKTTTVVNLGEMIHAENHSVVIVDGDLGMPNLGTLIDTDAESTIHDVLSGSVAVEDAVLTTDSGMAVLAGGTSIDAFATADPTELGGILQSLSEQFDYVLVDTGAGLSYEALLPLGLVDEIILVTTPDDSSVGDTKRTAEFARTVEGAIRGAVVTRVRTDSAVHSISDTLGTELLGVIPEDAVVAESTAAGEPLVTYAPESDATESYRQLSRVVLREASPDIPEPTSSTPSDSNDSTDSEEPSERPDEETERSKDELRVDDEDAVEPSGGLVARIKNIFSRA